MGEKGKEEWKKREERDRKRKGERERRREAERDLEVRNPKSISRVTVPKLAKQPLKLGCCPLRPQLSLGVSNARHWLKGARTFVLLGFYLDSGEVREFSSCACSKFLNCCNNF